MSQEGTIQGDSLAIPFYALSTVPLINSLNDQNVKQVWYADDATATGSLSAIFSWWKMLCDYGPSYGYHANADMTWLVVKEQHLNKVRDIFKNHNINITSKGRPHIGAPLGNENFTNSYVSNMVTERQYELQVLCKIEKTKPHVTYAAFTHELVNKFNFLCRTTLNIKGLLQPLQDCICFNFIPSLCGRAPPNDVERKLLALLARLEGLGLVNPTSLSSIECQASVKVTSPLCKLILHPEKHDKFTAINTQISAKGEIIKLKRNSLNNCASELKLSHPKSLQHAMALAQEKGASSWLTTIPLEEFGFTLQKGAFRDALTLRYGWQPANVPTNCSCGSLFFVEHALSCPKGGFPSLRHNEVRDLTVNLMAEVCHNISIEPHLQPLSGEDLHGASANTEAAARLDVDACGFWGGRFDHAFF